MFTFVLFLFSFLFLSFSAAFQLPYFPISICAIHDHHHRPSVIAVITGAPQTPEPSCRFPLLDCSQMLTQRLTYSAVRPSAQKPNCLGLTLSQQKRPHRALFV